MQQRLLRDGSVVAAVGVILLLTLTPTSAELTHADVWCLACGQFGGRDLVLNVVLFVPLGIALGLAGVPGRLAITLIASLTLGIELLQMQVIAGRDASLGDLLANAVGGSVGVVVGTHLGRLLRPPRALARRLTLVAAACATSLFLATAWGVQPSLPRTRYYAQWAADMSNFGHFTGSILWARAGTEEFPPIGEIAASARFRERILEGQAPVAALVLPSPTQEPRLSPILSVFDERRREMVLLGQEEHDVVFRLRTRSADALFPIVGVRLADVFAGSRSEGGQLPDSMMVAGGFSPGHFWMMSSARGETRRARYPLGPELGWFFLLPWQQKLGEWSGVLSALWVAGIFLPLAYWSWASASAVTPQGGGTRVWLSVPAVVALLSLWALPSILGYERAAWPAWVSAGVTTTLGWWLAVRGERRARRP